MLELDAKGKILSISSTETPDRNPFTEFYAGALIPGLVNAHCHLELSYLEGQIPEGEGFAAFARAMGEVRGRFTAEERLRAARRADAVFRREGVVAVGDVANDALVSELKRQSPIHYHTFAEVYGLKSVSAERQRPLLDYPPVTLTPHSIYSVQDALFRAICHEGEGPLSIHFLESEAETELYAHRGRLWEWYERVGFACDFLHYGSPARRLVESIPAEREVILVHNCCLQPQDLEQVMAHFRAPVHWCICPGSNHFISRLKPPVDLLRRGGVNICLGTDSAASNRSLSMLDELRRIEGVPLAERLQWATLGGARALGLADSLGSIEVGKCPGLALLEGLDWERMELTEQSTVRALR